MKEESRLLDYLEHILQAIGRIQDYTEDLDEVAFLKEKMTQDAVIRNLEVIGEASRNIERHFPNFRKSIQSCLWLQPTRCETPWHTVTSRSIWGSFGTPLKTIFPICKHRLRPYLVHIPRDHDC